MLASWRCRLRTNLGVMDSRISVFFSIFFWLPKSLPSNGESPSPGNLFTDRSLSLLISPAKIWFSPSFSRNVVLALRLPTV